MQVELEAGEEQHEGEAEEGEHLHGLVDLGPAEDVGADDDAEDDLDHGDGHPHEADAVDDERRSEGRDGHDRQAVEGDVAHVGTSAPYLRKTRSATRPVQPVWCEAPEAGAGVAVEVLEEQQLVAPTIGCEADRRRRRAGCPRRRRGRDR